MNVATLCLLFVTLFTVGCATTEPEEFVPPPRTIDLLTADEVARIQEEMTRPIEEPALVMNALERLIPTWQNAQRYGRAEPIERELTRKVVVNFDAIAEMYESGTHERQLVAAWALMFSRVPPNELGVESRHLDALDLMLPRLHDLPDDLLQNTLLAIWRIGEPSTPLSPMTDLVINHHDPVVRANACLVLSTILSEETSVQATEALLVALTDSDATVRLHAARAVELHPRPVLITHIQTILADEDSALVLSAMIRALGTANARASTPVLVFLLESSREIVAGSAHLALVQMYGKDLGTRRSDWAEVMSGG